MQKHSYEPSFNTFSTQSTFVSVCLLLVVIITDQIRYLGMINKRSAETQCLPSRMSAQRLAEFLDLPLRLGHPLGSLEQLHIQSPLGAFSSPVSLQASGS